MALLVSASGCRPQAPAQSSGVRAVKTIVVESAVTDRTRTFPGRVEAYKRTQLAFTVPGILEDMPVREGQRVAKGDVIAQLRRDEYNARLKVAQGQLDQARAVLRALEAGERTEERLRREANLRAAEARLANAKSEYDRFSAVLASRGVSRSEYERAETTYRIAQEEFEAARQLVDKGVAAREEDIDGARAQVVGLEGRVSEAAIMLADCTLKAPFDGVIARRYVEANQNIAPNAPIFEFHDVNEVDIAMDVPETAMGADVLTRDVERMTAKCAGVPDREFPVQIREVAQIADPATQTFRVRVGMKVPQDVTVLPGMTAVVTVDYRRADAQATRVLVPVSAIYRESGGEQVAWVVGADFTVDRRPVRVGTATGASVEVLDGLRPGDRIAVAGVSFLRDGAKVRDLGDALGSPTR